MGGRKAEGEVTPGGNGAVGEAPVAAFGAALRSFDAVDSSRLWDGRLDGDGWTKPPTRAGRGAPPGKDSFSAFRITFVAVVGVVFIGVVVVVFIGVVVV